MPGVHDPGRGGLATWLLFGLVGTAGVRACVEHADPLVRVAAWPLKRLATALRQLSHKARRRRTAKALHALRHDREHLLGTLPPIVTAQILRCLDPVSLRNLRLASRQSYLLVSCSLTRVSLTAADLVKYSQIPLAAVYPYLEVLCLRLSASTTTVELAVATQIFLGHSSTKQAQLPWSSSHTSEGLTVHGALSIAGQAGFFAGCHSLHTLDLSACTGGLDASSLAGLINSIHGSALEGLTVRLPAGCLQAPSGQLPWLAGAMAAAGETTAALQSSSTVDASVIEPSLRQLQRPLSRGSNLCLTGPGVLLRSDAHIHTLTLLGPCLRQISLLDLFPYSGSLTWEALGGLVGLRTLAVTPSSRASLFRLLTSLTVLPKLSTLLLADRPNADMVTPWHVELDWAQLEALAKLPSLTALEVPAIRLSSVSEMPVRLPQLQHLGADMLAWVRPLAALLPGLTSLSVGHCPRLGFLRQPITSVSGARMVTNAPASGPGVAQNAAPAAQVVAGGGGAGAPPPAPPAAQGPAGGAGVAGGLPGAAAVWNDGAPAAAAAIAAQATADAAISLDEAELRHDFPTINAIARLQHLQRLDLCGAVASQIVQLWGSGNCLVNGLSTVRELHIWRMASWDDLSLAAQLAQKLSGVLTVGLHGCGKGDKAQSDLCSPRDVMKAFSSAETLVLEGGDARAVQHLASAKLPRLTHLQLLSQPHVLPSEVAELLKEYGQPGSPLGCLEVRACRHITPACGPMLQQLAVRTGASGGHSTGTQTPTPASGPISSRPPVHVIVDSVAFRLD